MIFFNINNLLLYTISFPLLGVLILLFIPQKKEKLMKLVALNFSFYSFLSSLVIWLFFQKSVGSFQFVKKLFWFPLFNINFILGIDGISLFFLLLTTLLIPLCILASWNLNSYKFLKEFLISFLMLDFFLIGSFCSLDLLFFYIFFESVLIPMFFVIGIWGSRERKILASYYFFLYTLFGSLVMLLSIVYIYNQVGTTDYETILTFSFSNLEQKVLWLTFFLAFSSKVPMIPVHLWLPEAHVEAPTAGSIILAGVLLKLGTYGFIRFSLPFFPQASFFFTPLVYTIALIGVVFASFTAIRQTDFKRIIAYTSIAHMNLVVLGIFSFNIVGIEGAILQSLSHGFVASALFFVIGVVYERYKTRIVQYYGGLAIVMPIYITIFLFFTLSNMSFPGTGNFVGEFLILVGVFNVNQTIAFIGSLSVIIGASYSLWLFNRIAFGNLKTQYTQNFIDLNIRECIVFFPLMLGTIGVGIFPNIFLSCMHLSVSYIVELLYF